MADGIKPAIAQAVRDVGEAVAKPVVDEFAKSMEQGVKTIAQGPTALDPAVLQKQRVEEEKKKAWWRHVIKWYRDIESKKREDRQLQLQQEQLRKQEEEKKTKVRQFKVEEAKKLPPPTPKKNMENRMGKGVGG